LSGDLTVTSEIDQGSCFTATVALLPARQCQWVNSTKEVTALSEFKRHQKVLNAALVGNVLLAEDNDVIRQLITVLLEKIGLTVSTVNDGLQLVKKVQTESFDLIISDIHMPRMGGVEAVKLLKQSGCNVPFIALTANAIKDDITSYLCAGFDGYLGKPIERDKFVQVISTVLKVDLASEDLSSENLEVPKEVLNELQLQFISGLPNNVEELKLAHQSKDSKRLKFLVHRLNGAASVFKFEQISNAARGLENKLIIDGMFAEKEQAIELIETLCNAMSDAMDMHLKV
jgi:CheY-like chemotaxis protein/HPt (histidine-containing phosphotransfer) domain-containing protein